MSAERRLDAVALALTPRERAILAARNWSLSEEELDDPLITYTPADQRDEVLRLCIEISKVSDDVHFGNTIIFEWVYQEDLCLGWLQGLDALLGRLQHLEELVAQAGWGVVEGDRAQLRRKEREVVVPPLRPPSDGLERVLPLLWGQPAFPDDDSPPATSWPEQHDRLATTMRRAIELRWSCYLAQCAVFEQLADAVGEDLVHTRVRKQMAALRQSLLRQYAALQEIVGPFPLPDADPDKIAMYGEGIDWALLRGETTSNAVGAGRRWQPADDLEKLEVLEARLAEELRTKPQAEPGRDWRAAGEVTAKDLALLRHPNHFKS